MATTSSKFGIGTVVPEGINPRNINDGYAQPVGAETDASYTKPPFQSENTGDASEFDDPAVYASDKEPSDGSSTHLGLKRNASGKTSKPEMSDPGRNDSRDQLEESGSGLVLFSLFVGLAVAAGFYFVNRVGLDAGWSFAKSAFGLSGFMNGFASTADPGGIMSWAPSAGETHADHTPANIALSITLSQSMIVFALSWIVLAERRDFLRPIIPAAVISAALAYPTYWLANTLAADAPRLVATPFAFWFGLGMPVSMVSLLALTKSFVLGQGGRNYTTFFFHGLTTPLVFVSASLFGGLLILLLSAWGSVVGSIGGESVQKALTQSWVILPSLGVVGGLSVGIIRSQRALLGAFRYGVVASARLAMPILALASIGLAASLSIYGPTKVLTIVSAWPLGYAGLLGFSVIATFCFNGVYQNGEDHPPSGWLRLPMLLTVITTSIAAGLSTFGFWTSLTQGGASPLTLFGLGLSGLVLAYSFVWVVGLASEIKWRREDWMPIIRPMNTAAAGVIALAFIGLSTPAFNTWAITAQDRENIFIAGDVAAEDYDFGYLALRLGTPGEEVLNRLLDLKGHPEAATIRARIQSARTFETYGAYKRHQKEIKRRSLESLTEPNASSSSSEFSDFYTVKDYREALDAETAIKTDDSFGSRDLGETDGFDLPLVPASAAPAE